jgi:hypothetical protein
MIIDRIEPIALRMPRPGGDSFCLTLARVTTRRAAGLRRMPVAAPADAAALFATIRDAIAPHYLGKSVDDRRR